MEYDVVVTCHDKAVNLGDLLDIWVSDEELHISDGGSELPWVDVIPVGALQGVRSGGPPYGVDWGSYYYAGPLETDPGRELITALDFWELAVETPLPEARMDLGCAEALDAAQVCLDC